MTNSYICTNVVIFTCTERFEDIVAFFKAIQVAEKNDKELMRNYVIKWGRFYNIMIEVEDDLLSIHYDTLFEPNINELLKVVKHLQADCEYFYLCTGQHQIGTLLYNANNDQFELIELEREQFSMVTFDEQTFTYKFEDENYPQPEDAWAIILDRLVAERKKQKPE